MLTAACSTQQAWPHGAGTPGCCRPEMLQLRCTEDSTSQLDVFSSGCKGASAVRHSCLTWSRVQAPFPESGGKQVPAGDTQGDGLRHNQSHTVQNHCTVPSPHSRNHPKHRHCKTQQPLFASPGRLGETRHHTEETPNHNQLLPSLNKPLTFPRKLPDQSEELLPLYPLSNELVQLEG